jgi:YtcA family
MKVVLGERGAHRAVLTVIAECPVMRWRPLLKSIVRGPLLAFALSGCAVRGAPSFVIAGSYFPGWMFCALIGIVLAIAVRIGFVTSGLARVLPFQLFVCTAIGLCCGLIAWLLWFGQ